MTKSTAAVRSCLTWLTAQAYAKLPDVPAEDKNDSQANRSVFLRGLGKLKEFVRQWLRPSGLRRKLALSVSWLILIGIGYLSIKWTYNHWTQSGHRIAFNDKLTIATLAIAFFAALFALLAYQISTGAPNLRLGIMFYNQDWPYEHRLEYTTDYERWRRLGCWFKSLVPPSENPEEYLGDPDWFTHIAYMWVDNRSRYPAKSPSVRVRFGKETDKSPMGLCCMNPLAENPDEPWRHKEAGPGWIDTSFKTSGIVLTATQWDGGSTYPIHGKSSRRLPNLPLVTLYSEETKTNKLRVELLAEGYRKVVKVKVNINLKVLEHIAPMPAHARQTV
jgi:hypothetical protein